MRTFFIISHKFSGEINLNDLPGSGRIDLVTRCINSAIFLSHNIRRDILFYVFFLKIEVLIKIDSSRVKYLNPDERSTAALIRNAILKMKKGEKATPGFFIKKANLESALNEISKLGKIYYLHEFGKDLRTIEFGKAPVFILSDSVNMSEEEEKKIMNISEEVISVSPKVILASHAITIVNNELDRRGA